MISKQIRRRLKEELTYPGASTLIRYDAKLHGHIKSFRSTVMYVANTLHMKIATDYNEPHLWVQRIDASPLDMERLEFSPAKRGDLARAVELIRLLEPAPSDPLCNLKTQLVYAAEDALVRAAEKSDATLDAIMRGDTNEG
jgi:hypothetical protein